MTSSDKDAAHLQLIMAGRKWTSANVRWVETHLEHIENDEELRYALGLLGYYDKFAYDYPQKAINAESQNVLGFVVSKLAKNFSGVSLTMAHCVVHDLAPAYVDELAENWVAATELNSVNLTTLLNAIEFLIEVRPKQAFDIVCRTLAIEAKCFAAARHAFDIIRQLDSNAQLPIDEKLNFYRLITLNDNFKAMPLQYIPFALVLSFELSLFAETAQLCRRALDEFKNPIDAWCLRYLHEACVIKGCLACVEKKFDDALIWLEASLPKSAHIEWIRAPCEEPALRLANSLLPIASNTVVDYLAQWGKLLPTFTERGSAYQRAMERGDHPVLIGLDCLGVELISEATMPPL